MPVSLRLQLTEILMAIEKLCCTRTRKMMKLLFTNALRGSNLTPLDVKLEALPLFHTTLFISNGAHIKTIHTEFTI